MADSKAAQSYLIDPLTAPEPSQETGLGSHFVAPPESTTGSATTASSSTNPFRRSTPTKDGPSSHVRQVSGSAKDGPSSHVRQISRGSNHSPSSSMSRTTKFPNYREEALGGLNDSPLPRRSLDGPPTYDNATGRRRGSSLAERFPGDNSNRPLDIIRKDSKKAYRSPHLSRRQIHGADSIDQLDPTINKIPYHHEGPYDAASMARNQGPMAPIAALADSNREALKATAPENVKDSLHKGVPLDGVAIVPPGQADRLGHVYNYEEGPNQMFEGQPEGGQYKRWEGVDYDENDVHGQGEPSYSLDRRLQAHTLNERNGERGIELTERPLMSDYDKDRRRDRKSLDTRDPVEIAGDDGKYVDLQHASAVDANRASGSQQRKGSIRDGIKRRIGSIKHRD